MNARRRATDSPAPRPPFGGLDPERADLVSLVGHDWRGADDWRRFLSCLTACAGPDGLVSQNDVRRALTGVHGLDMEPRRYSSSWRRATCEGILSWSADDPACYDVNDDTRSGNRGKPQRRYRLVSLAGGSR